MSHVVFDLDDCGVTTHSVLIDMHRRIMPDFEVPSDQFLTKENAPALPAILEDGQYMALTQIRPGFIHAVRRLKDLGHKTYICTHRGFHKRGKEFTEELLGDDIDAFTDIFYLDPYNPMEKDKTQFLSRTLGNDFYLVDDNPGFKGNYNPDHVILYETPWNKNCKSLASIRDWTFTTLFGALALTQSKLRRTVFDGNFEH